MCLCLRTDLHRRESDKSVGLQKKSRGVISLQAACLAYALHDNAATLRDVRWPRSGRVGTCMRVFRYRVRFSPFLDFFLVFFLGLGLVLEFESATSA